jgi:hypothetical protein
MDTADTWRGILTSKDFGQPIVEAEELEGVVTLLQKHRIAFEIFGGNVIEILSDGRSRTDPLGERPAFPTSPSIKDFTDPFGRPMGAPVWMMAAFPDVVTWLQEVLDAEGGPESAGEILGAVYGIDPTTNESEIEKALLTPDGKVQAKCYSHAVDEYLRKTNKPLEVAVQAGSSSDVYAGQILLNAAGEESNFTLIARNTAMAYLHLKRQYLRRVPHETILVAGAGAVDAMVYLAVTHQIREAQILSLAETAANSSNQLLEFMIQFEALLLSVDTPSVSHSEVLKACRDQTESITRTIAAVLSRGVVRDDIVSAVELFMNDRRFKRIRNRLSITKR